MRPRNLALLLGFAATLVLAGWALMEAPGGPATPEDSDSGGVSVAAKGAIPPARPAGADDGFAIADAAIVDPSLLDPRPIVPSIDPAQRLAALRMPGSVQGFSEEAVGSLQWAPAIAAVKNAIVVPRLDREETLTLRHIAEIKASLNLSPDQERHWPALETELRQLVQRLVAQKAAGGKKAPITAAEAQRLYWAAGPLVLSLRQDQKEELRRLARAMGLDQVAALL